MKFLLCSIALIVLSHNAVSAEESALAKPLRIFDANNDGKLSDNELILAKQAFNRSGRPLEDNQKFLKEISERRLKNWKEQQLKYLDLNGNNILDKKESQRAELIWKEISREIDLVRVEILRKYDKNDDGELSQSEREVSRAEFDTKRKAIEEKVMAAHPKTAAP